MSPEKVSFREINRLALPAIVAGIAEPLISLTDMAVIGNVQTHAVEALAAAGIVGSFLSAIVWILAQTKTAISSLVSRHLGAGRLHAVKTLVPQAILFNLGLSLIIYLGTSLLAESLFRLYNAEGLLLQYTASYYRIRALGYPLTLVTFALFGVFRGLQNTSWAMKCSLAGALVNVLLDLVLVYGIEGMVPALHLEGAAIASVIAQGVMLVMALNYYFSKTPFRLHPGKALNPNLKALLLMSLNLFVRTAALNYAIYLANAFATDYGPSYIAAQTLLMNIWLFFSFFIDGYANAGNALSGKLLGAGEYRKLWWLSRDISAYAIVIALLLAACCLLGYSNIGQWFTQDQEVLRLFASVFWIVLFMQPLNAIAFVYDGLFKGLGEAVYLRNVLLAATFLGFVPALWIGHFLDGKLYAIWFAFAIWMSIRAGGLVWKFRRKYLLSDLKGF